MKIPEQQQQSFTKRVKWIQGVFLIVAAVVFGRAVFLQLFENRRLESKAERQYLQRKSLALQRGPILDRNGVLLAVSLPMSSIYVIPQEIENPYDASSLLSALLGINEAYLSEAMTSQKSFTWVKRYVTPIERDQVMGLGIKGIYF